MYEFSDKLIELLKDRHTKVVVMTGAGCSAESGVPTFRGEDGLWRNYNPMELATPQAFSRDPKLVWEWYLWRMSLIAKCRPNPAHYTIAKMEHAFDDFLLVTQNVDGLHHHAGSKRLVELHGNIWRAKTVSAGDKMMFEFAEPELKQIPPNHPQTGEMLRPDVVWFGEALDPRVMDQAIESTRGCNLMLVVGTSGQVQPAASFSFMAKDNGAYIVEINRDPTPLTPYADVSYQGKAGEIMAMLDTYLDRD